MFDLSPATAMLDARVPTGLGGRWYGVYPALVTDINDPEGEGRVKVTLPWAPDAGSARYEAWARLAVFMGGANRGAWFIPDVNDEVVVAFGGGDPRNAFVLGGLWNGRDAPPEIMDASGRNERKVLRSRNGVKVTLDDSSGRESLLLETPGGQRLTLKDGPGAVEIVDSNGNSIKLETAGITVTASAKVTVNASSAEITACTLTVNAGMANFSGVVQCSTLISNSVVSASYTPGAGNIW
jgi:uncharacterized protein involved in type VI secretion and phage assembly